MSKLITLHAWGLATYGDSAPGINTLRRWARGNKIAPRPVKHGRTYFVSPGAEYVTAYVSERVRLVERIRRGAVASKRK